MTRASSVRRRLPAKDLPTCRKRPWHRTSPAARSCGYSTAGASHCQVSPPLPPRASPDARRIARAHRLSSGIARQAGSGSAPIQRQRCMLDATNASGPEAQDGFCCEGRRAAKPRHAVLWPPVPGRGVMKPRRRPRRSHRDGTGADFLRGRVLHAARWHRSAARRSTARPRAGRARPGQAARSTQADP